MNKNRSISLILLIAVYIILFIAVIALLHERNLQIMNIPKWRSHLIRQNRATYSNLENHLIQITEPGNPI